MKDSFGYDARGVAMILVLMAFVMMTIQGGAIRPMVARFGEKKLMLVGVALMCLAFTAIPWPGTVPILLLPLILASVGRAISQPSMLGLVSFEGTDATKGALLGAFHSSASAARVLGPLAAGALYDLARPAPFLLAAGLTATAVVVALRIPGPPADQRR